MTIKTAVFVILAAGTSLATPRPAWAQAPVQGDDEVKAITARVRGTFQDARGGLGVVSGDMTIVRFEVRNGALVATGAITGAMADARGNILGQVAQELTMSVGDVASTCNQLRIELAAADADVLQMPVHFDAEVAGFDSRDGTTPRALGALCSAQQLLRGKPTTAALGAALNDFAASLAAGRAR